MTDRMSDKELQEVSSEDLEMFQALVTDSYGRPWEESYQLLRAEIRRRLLRRQTNPTYLSMLREEVDDLVTRVMLRYSIVYGKIRRAGKPLDNFEALLENRVWLVYCEALRRYAKRLPFVPVDDPDFTQPPDPSLPADRALEEEDERKRLNRCYIKCLRELPEHALGVLIEYCDTENYPPHERAQMRLRLALREANISADRATPEQIHSARNSLNVKVSRWRSKDLEPCMGKCLGLRTSAYVGARRGRGAEG